MTPRPAEAAYNAANQAHIDHVAQAAERVEKERLFSICETLKTYQGRLVFWDLLATCGVFRSVFSPDPVVMAFNAGRQELGHKLQGDLLAADASLYDQMAREARARAKQEAAVTRAVLAPSDDGEQEGDR